MTSSDRIRSQDMPPPQMILDEAEALRQLLTPENCYRLADEAVTALEQARAAAAADDAPETKATLVKANTRAHALLIALSPANSFPGGIKSALLEAALDRLDEIPLWEVRDT